MEEVSIELCSKFEFSPGTIVFFSWLMHIHSPFPLSIMVDRYGPVEFENRIIQPAIWVDQAGMTHMVARSLRKYMVATHSKDSGHSWMPPILTGVPCPNSGLDVVGNQSSKGSPLHMNLSPATPPFWPHSSATG